MPGSTKKKVIKKSHIKEIEQIEQENYKIKDLKFKTHNDKNIDVGNSSLKGYICQL
jgi:hypothetical protein